MSHLNKLEGVAAKRFLSSGDHAVSVTPPPALYKSVADSKEMSHTFFLGRNDI